MSVALMHEVSLEQWSLIGEHLSSWQKLPLWLVVRTYQAAHVAYVTEGKGVQSPMPDDWLDMMAGLPLPEDIVKEMAFHIDLHEGLPIIQAFDILDKWAASFSFMTHTTSRRGAGARKIQQLAIAISHANDSEGPELAALEEPLPMCFDQAIEQMHAFEDPPREGLEFIRVFMRAAIQSKSEEMNLMWKPLSTPPAPPSSSTTAGQPSNPVAAPEPAPTAASGSTPTSDEATHQEGLSEVSS